ncbi:MAG: inorganic diphosphatase [Parcubacteria group bacterium]|nr:inorganic diphosphatase [Parcubacteria group bacterium]
MDYSKLKIGDKTPDIIFALIEIPRGSSNKYEFDLQYETIRLDRVLHSAVYYPGDYGLVPETISDDGDPADILVIISHKTFPGCLLRVKPIGLLLMEDGGKKDFKILGVAYDDPVYTNINSYNDLPNHLIKQVVNFFETYKVLEGKTTKVLGWEDAITAKEYIQKVHNKYLQSRNKP